MGWGQTSDEEDKVDYWIGCNSWGDYWGEQSFFRIELGKNLLGIEKHITWVTPGFYTIDNVACFEDGCNCKTRAMYIDPFQTVALE